MGSEIYIHWVPCPRAWSPMLSGWRMPWAVAPAEAIVLAIAPEGIVTSLWTLELGPAGRTDVDRLPEPQ